MSNERAAFDGIGFGSGFSELGVILGEMGSSRVGYKGRDYCKYMVTQLIRSKRSF